MVPFTYTVRYGLERQRELLNTPHRELPVLSPSRPSFAVRKALSKVGEWARQAFEREGELCLKLAPACEMRFS
jgi:hypothetical protein